MKEEEFESYSTNCLKAASEEFDFEKQMDRCYKFIEEIN